MLNNLFDNNSKFFLWDLQYIRILYSTMDNIVHSLKELEYQYWIQTYSSPIVKKAKVIYWKPTR